MKYFGSYYLHLFQIAERWAYQCSGGHDQNRVSQRFQVGQNVAKQSMWSYGQEIQLEVDWATPIKNWYDEVQQFDKKSQKGFGERYLIRFYNSNLQVDI